jgi:hypothetical protein
MLKLTSGIIVAFAALSMGCSSSGGSGGGGSGSGGVHELGSLDEDCSGVTASEVLDAAAPSYTSTFTYNGGEPNGGATAQLTLAVSYAQGKLVCHPPLQSGPTGPDEGPHVTVDVEVAFATDDGAFHERLTGELDGFDSNSAHLSGSVPQSDLGGTYDPNMPDLQDVSVSLDASLTPTGTQGTLLKGGQKSAQVGEVAFVGSW